MFEITGTTGSVMTTLSAFLTGNQSLMTKRSGVSASSEMIFTFTLPDISSLPLLSFVSPLSIGPHQTLTVPINMTLPPVSVALQPDTPCSFFAAPDTESSGSAPRSRSPSLYFSLLYNFSALLGRRGWRVRLNRDTDPRRRERLQEQC